MGLLRRSGDSQAQAGHGAMLLVSRRGQAGCGLLDGGAQQQLSPARRGWRREERRRQATTDDQLQHDVLPAAQVTQRGVKRPGRRHDPLAICADLVTAHLQPHDLVDRAPLTFERRHLYREVMRQQLPQLCAPIRSTADQPARTTRPGAQLQHERSQLGRGGQALHRRHGGCRRQRAVPRQFVPLPSPTHD